MLQMISPVPILVDPSVKVVVKPNHKTAWKVSLASLSLQANLEGCIKGNGDPLLLGNGKMGLWVIKSLHSSRGGGMGTAETSREQAVGVT